MPAVLSDIVALPAPGLLSKPWLVADIGGTNARFGAVFEGETRVKHVQSFAVAAHGGPADAVAAYLTDLSRSMGSAYQVPRHAAFAVATAVTSDDIDFTNSNWKFSRSAVQAELHLDSLLALNDFEALALSLPRLQADQLRAHGELPSGKGTLAVVGPGTGLGVAAVKFAGAGWLAIPGEGGHATLAPYDDFESELLRVLRMEFDHVSAERLLSGIGLPLLHSAVAKVLGVATAPLTAQHVVERGLLRSDAVTDKTIDAFCNLLGSFCGNVALTVGARGGLYIGGGIVPRLGERFFHSGFRERFEAKGRFRSYLEAIPTAVIIDTLAALTGAAVAIEQDHR
jgi:glucokinase